MAVVCALLPLAVYLVLCLAVQAYTHAWDLAFVTYPDEPSHFVGSVMVRDFIVTGPHNHPVGFARNYYAHYPYFAIGYWPPLFYAISGVWMLVAGVGRFQELLLCAFCGAGMAWMTCLLARRRAGQLVAFCAGLLLLSMPVVQQWMCAVMVDEMVALFSLAAAVCLLRYLDRPTAVAALGCAVLCACATLTKYSGLFVCALPFGAMLFLRRFDLLRRVSFYLQPAVVGLLVWPWVHWTSGLAQVGLPSGPAAPALWRLRVFPLELFRSFPPLMAVFVFAGVALLAVRPRAWRADICVTALLGAGLLAFLIISPVGPERRYLLVADASLIVLAFAGWAEALAPLEARGGKWSHAFAALAGVVTAISLVLGFGAYLRPRNENVTAAVRAVVQNAAWQGKRILVSPDLEGPVIAEFAVQDPQRPGYELLRPLKLFAQTDWFGGGYQGRFRTPDEMMNFLKWKPVTLVLWHEPGRPRWNHEHLLAEALRRNPECWRRKPIPTAGPDWAIYEFIPAK